MLQASRDIVLGFGLRRGPDASLVTSRCMSEPLSYIFHMSCARPSRTTAWSPARKNNVRRPCVHTISTATGTPAASECRPSATFATVPVLYVSMRHVAIHTQRAPRSPDKPEEFKGCVRPANVRPINPAPAPQQFQDYFGLSLGQAKERKKKKEEKEAVG